MTDLDPTNNRLCVIGESDLFLARLLQRFAEKSGLAVQHARTGEEVLDLARREQPALIVLEPELPGKLRGWEAAQALREDPSTSAIPLIICTWLVEAEAQALVGALITHLQKPDLHYEGFLAALDAAGVKSAPDE
jgi:two-component system, chemotaxis family, chemotaxis protein CheY